jgi:hypothetical protein
MILTRISAASQGGSVEAAADASSDLRRFCTGLRPVRSAAASLQPQMRNYSSDPSSCPLQEQV